MRILATGPSGPPEELEALRRVHDHLEPGGLLALDFEETGSLPTVATDPEHHDPPADRVRASDGSELALRVRVVEVDRPERRVTRAIEAWQWRDGELLVQEEHLLTESVYGREELNELLQRAGFVDVEVRSGASAWGYDMIVFLARRPEV